MKFTDDVSSRLLISMAIVVSFFGYANFLLASNSYKVPAEIELSGGESLGFGNNGVATSMGSSAVHLNPALLVLGKQYRLRASYVWPSSGREIFQFGVVDGTTAKLAAGAQYSEFTEDYKIGGLLLDGDSPVKRRLSVGVAYPFAFLSVGLAAHYTEAFREQNLVLEPYRGVTIGLGALARLTESLRIGLSMTHLNNSKLKNVAPLFLRAGVSWTVIGEVWEVFADFRQRDRIPVIEGPIESADASTTVPQSLTSGFEKPERMISIGSRVRIYDVLELGASYGQSVSEDQRQELGGRAALVHDEFSLSYNVAQTSLESSRLHSAISFSLQMKM